MAYDPKREEESVFASGRGQSADPRAEVRGVFPGGVTQLFKDDPSTWSDEQLRVGHAALVKSAQDKANGCWVWLALSVGAFFFWKWALILFGGLVLHSIYSSLSCSHRQSRIREELERRVAQRKTQT